MNEKFYDFGDLDAPGIWDDDDTPPEPGGAIDLDALPADLFIERMERARAARVREIIAHEGGDINEVPDRLPEGFWRYRKVNGKWMIVAGKPPKRGRPCKNGRKVS